MSEVSFEYAIEWESPEDIAGSITVCGFSTTGREKAARWIKLAGSLPGGQRGRRIFRTITTSDWTEV